MPATVATVFVPDSVPAPGFAPIAAVTLPAKFVAVLPSASRTITWIAGARPAPPVEDVGSTVTASCAAAPGATANGTVETLGSPAEDTTSVYPLPTLSIVTSVNVAIPPTAATVFVPDKVPPAESTPIAIVTSPVKLVAVLPSESLAVTCTGGDISVPALTPFGCTVTASSTAGPASMLKGGLAPPPSPVPVAARV